MPIDRDELSPEEAWELLNKLLDGDMKRLSLLRSILVNHFGASLLRRYIDPFLPKIMKKLNLMAPPAANVTDDSPIKDLGIDGTIINLLKKASIYTVRQLRETPDSTLLDIRMFGQTRVDEVRARLKMVDEANADSPN